jgi:hypothetical protein
MGPVHRTHWSVIIGSVLALAAVLVGVAAVFVYASNQQSKTHNGNPGLTPAPLTSTPAPLTSTPAVITPTPQQPTPVTTGTSRPVTSTASPTTPTIVPVTPLPTVAPPTPTTVPPTPVPSSSGTQVGIDTLSFTMPAGWEIYRQKRYLVEVDRKGQHELLTFASAKLNTPATVEQLKADIVDANKARTNQQNVHECQKRSAHVNIDGAIGLTFILCFTYAPQSGQAVNLVEFFWIATNHGGGAYYEIIMEDADSTYDSFANLSTPVMNTVHWKLR